jgi:hypothetical protein
VPSVERRQDHFGPGTEAAIRRFQAETSNSRSVELPSNRSDSNLFVWDTPFRK